MKGSHRRLKRMLRNSGGLSLLRGCLGVQVVVDNHTIDDNLRAEGWDVTKRSMRGQGPVTVQPLARRSCKRALSDLNYVHSLSQQFQTMQTTSIVRLDGSWQRRLAVLW